MTWIDRVMNSDAGRGSPELAQVLIKAVGEKVPQDLAPREDPEAEDD